MARLLRILRVRTVTAACIDSHIGSEAVRRCLGAIQGRQYVLCVFTEDSFKIGFSSRRSCHEVTDEVKSHGIMLYSARHWVGRHDLMPPIL